MLVAFTGCDGCGKSTQVRRAAEWLTSLGVSVHVLNKWQIMDRDLFPECRFIDGSIDDFRECIAEMDGVARTLLAVWPIAITAQRIPKLQTEFDVILADGYWMKVAAAELSYGASDSLVRACVEQIQKPDLTLLLDTSPQQTLDRKIAADLLTPYECGCDAGLSHEKYLSQQGNIRATLRGWADEYSWKLISAEPSVDEVWETVKNTLEHHLCERGMLFHFPRHS